MFVEEKCPNCGSTDYEIQDDTENFQDDYCSREWYCECCNCKSEFVITYIYELKSIEVSAS